MASNIPSFYTNPGTSSTGESSNHNLPPPLKLSQQGAVVRTQSDTTTRVFRSSSAKHLRNVLTPRPIPSSDTPYSPPLAPRKNPKKLNLPSSFILNGDEESSSEGSSRPESSTRGRRSSSLLKDLTEGSPKGNPARDEGLVSRSKTSLVQEDYETYPLLSDKLEEKKKFAGKKHLDTKKKRLQDFDSKVKNRIHHLFVIGIYTNKNKRNSLEKEITIDTEDNFIRVNILNSIATNRILFASEKIYQQTLHFNGTITHTDYQKLIHKNALELKTDIQKPLYELAKQFTERWVNKVSYLRLMTARVLKEPPVKSKKEDDMKIRTHWSTSLLIKTSSLQELLIKKDILGAIKWIETCEDPGILSLIYLTVSEEREDATSILQTLKYWLTDESLEHLKREVEKPVELALLEKRVKETKLNFDSSSSIASILKETINSSDNIYQIHRCYFPDHSKKMLLSSFTINGQEIEIPENIESKHHIHFFNMVFTTLPNSGLFQNEEETLKQTELLLANEPCEGLEILTLGAMAGWNVPYQEFNNRFLVHFSNKYSARKDPADRSNLKFNIQSSKEYSVLFQKEYTLYKKTDPTKAASFSIDGKHPVAKFMVRWEVKKEDDKYSSSISFPTMRRGKETSDEQWTEILKGIENMQFSEEITFSNPELDKISLTND